MPSSRETYLYLMINKMAQDRAYQQELLRQRAREQMQNRSALVKSAYETGQMDFPTALESMEGRNKLLGATQETAPGMADALTQATQQRFGRRPFTPVLRTPQAPQAPEGFVAVPTYKGNRVSGYQMKPKPKGMPIQDRSKYEDATDEVLSEAAQDGDEYALRVLQRKYPGFK